MKINILTPINVQQQKVRSDSSRRGVFIRTEYLYVSTFSGKASRSAFTCELLSEMMERFGQTEYPLQQANLLKQICYVCVNSQQPIDEKA